MKKFLVLWLVILWLAATTAAMALPRCLKGPAFDRTGVITTSACDASACCGNCSHATATFIGTQPGHDHDGLWLTSTHAVGNAILGNGARIWINGYLADYIGGACVKVEDACVEAPEAGWVVLKTVDYVPCGVCPAPPDFGTSCCGRQLFFVDVRKCNTVTKCHVTSYCADSTLFKTDTLPDCPNCGAVAYDMCGRMVAILVGGGKSCHPSQCGRCERERYTAFLPLTPEMFACLAGAQPADTTAVIAQGATRCYQRACDACAC